MNVAPIDVAVRLADEGVPVRAIARAIKVSASELRERLCEAKFAGLLLALPHDDWPPGFPRDARALQLSRLAIEDRDVLFTAVQQVFGMTRTQGTLLLGLIHKEMVSRERDDMTVRTLDVHLCRMRQLLAPFAIKIVTLWGSGYRLSPEDRRKAMDLLSQHVKVL